MRLPGLHFRKSRRYPIQRDEKGHSLRERCFSLFLEGKLPPEVMVLLHMKKETVYRYYRDWLKCDPYFDSHYTFTSRLFNKTNPEREKNIELFSTSLGISKEEFEAVLSRPHGLHQLMKGKLYFPAYAEADHKMHIAIKLGLLMADHLVKKKGSYEDVYFALEHLLKKLQREREDDEEDIEANNEFMTFARQVMKADLENENINKMQPLNLTQEEGNTINRWMMDAEIRDLKMWYWPRIFYLMSEGISEEEAREKIYQNLLAKGNIKAARLMRKLQDKIHPLKDSLHPPLPPKDPSLK
jgi:hypothetical protein